MNIIQADPRSLIPYELNNRKHPEQQINRIANSISEFGFNQPIIVDEQNIVLVGHGRLAAALKLGLDKVPVLQVLGLTEAKKKAYRILDNKLQNDSEWDFNNLELELAHLEDLGFELEPWGLDELLPKGDEPEVYEDDGGGALPDEPYIKRGDIIELGPHRVMCGDSTSAEDVEELMRGECASLLVTSPPYDHQRDYTGESFEWDGLMRGVFKVAPISEKSQLLVNLGLIHREGEWIPYWDKWVEWMREEGWKRFALYVWDQGPGMPGDWNGRLAPSFELIFHFNKESADTIKARECKHAGESHTGNGQRGRDGKVKPRSRGHEIIQEKAILDSVIRVNRQGAAFDAGDHPAPFPVGVPGSLIMSWPGDVFDPFLGSGTTLIAADQLNRICYGMEISPAYCQVILERYKAHCEKVGKPFVCKINGEPFIKPEV